MEPRKPEHPDPFAAAFLERLQNRPEAEQFVLGGYFALKHYLDYRQTGDVDAWWLSREDPRALAAAREAFVQTAAEFGYSVRERSWGETISLEAVDGANKTFSFQVSVRSVEIEPPVPSPWGRFPIETLDDNVASKMVALVARGAPRDFVDVKAIVDAGLVTAERCWESLGSEGHRDRHRRCARQGEDPPREHRGPQADRADPRRAPGRGHATARMVSRRVCHGQA